MSDNWTLKCRKCGSDKWQISAAIVCSECGTMCNDVTPRYRPVGEGNKVLPEHPVRTAMLESLAIMAERLDHFEQTLHGVIYPFNIEAVARNIVDTYYEPEPHAISNLRQNIQGLIKLSRTPPEL